MTCEEFLEQVAEDVTLYRWMLDERDKLVAISLKKILDRRPQ